MTALSSALNNRTVRCCSAWLLAIFCTAGITNGEKMPAVQLHTDNVPTAPYLLAGAPTFDTTVTQFRERYNSHNPTLPIGGFHTLEGPSKPANLTRAASKINETLYASVALEKGSGKIKTLQLTYLPIACGTEKIARATAIAYMAALMREFEPTISAEQSTARVLDLLIRGQGSRFFQQQWGALRYVVADNGDKGLTFAVEPVKLVLAEP